MGLIKLLKKRDRLYKKYGDLDGHMEVKESLKKGAIDKTVGVNYYGYSDYLVIRHSRGSLYLSLKEADAIRKHLNKLF